MSRGIPDSAAVLRAVAQFRREERADGIAEVDANIDGRERELLRKGWLEKQATASREYESATRFVGLALNAVSIGRGVAKVVDAASPPPVAPDTPAAGEEDLSGTWDQHVETGISSTKSVIGTRLGASDEQLRKHAEAIDRATEVHDRITRALREQRQSAAELDGLIGETRRKVPSSD